MILTPNKGYDIIRCWHELHKIIDEKGLEWLKRVVYPVVIDPSLQVFEDAWKSSGLTPYGQYFRNVKEYINPANGHLTITQIDLKGAYFKDYLMSQWGLNIGQIDVSTCTKMRKLG